MRLRPWALVAVLALALVGCAEEGPSPTEPTGPAVPPSEVRAVIATSAAPAPDSLVKQQFDALDCKAAPVPVAADEQGAACDAEGTKYSLGPAVVVGGIESAQAGQDPSGLWVVDVEFEAGASETLGDLTSELTATGGRVALLVAGVVISAPMVAAPITDGRLQISGDFDEEDVTTLADQLSAG